MKMLRTLAVLVAALLAGQAAHALKITDERGVTVTLNGPPQRIVSLLPSLTETVCELGSCARLVGVDRYSNHPASVRALPQVGGGIDPNVEAIVALKPDVVLLAVSSRASQRLEALGVKVIALEPRTATDVPRVMGKLGELLEVPDALRIWRTIDAGVKAAAQSLPPQAKNVRVYFEVSRGPYAAGQSSFIGETMQQLGVRNIITPDLGPFPKINPEYVVRANPDVIMISERNAHGMEQRPGWAGMRAMREKRVCIFNADDADVLVRPGPRMAEAARIMARCIAQKSAEKAP